MKEKDEIRLCECCSRPLSKQRRFCNHRCRAMVCGTFKSDSPGSSWYYTAGSFAARSSFRS